MNKTHCHCSAEERVTYVEEIGTYGNGYRHRVRRCDHCWGLVEILE